MKKYAIAGASGRGLHMYAKPISTELRDYAQLVGIYDINKVRADIVSRECGNVPIYSDFDQMIAEAKPDIVIVTTVDKFHHEYIVRALDAGCGVITEKPMAIDGEKCKQVLDAEKRAGKKVIVTFNYRFAPYATRVKELIKEGVVGQITNVHFEWILDTKHGADYFRRWHRYLDKSGGLLVHKATHHFDVINWWLEEDPEEVYAFGARRFYGPTRENRGERCLTCPYKKECEFYWDITKNEFTEKFYHQAEKEDGYFRDRCVFADDIDIYDTMSVNVKYSKGALLSYSLIAHSPYEGWKATINGTKGRLEAEQFHSGQRVEDPIQQIKLFNRKGEEIIYNMQRPTGDHSGGDERIRRMIFVGDVPDPLGHQAGTWAGAMSALIGAGANISIAQGKPVRIKDMLKL